MMGREMGQNNDTNERGDLQGQQGGLLSRNRSKEEQERQKPEGYAGKSNGPPPLDSKDA
ncbi:MAG: hypothetical protein ACREHV_16545 [Rhizomicrobium sp.]